MLSFYKLKCVSYVSEPGQGKGLFFIILWYDKEKLKMKPLEDKKAYKLRIYDQNKKFLEILHFDNFDKLENFIWKLFNSNYVMNEIIDTSIISMHVYAPKNPSIALDIARMPDRKEIWFYNKKEKKHFVFSEPKYNKGKDFYLLLVNYFPLNKTLNKKKIVDIYKKKKREEERFENKKSRLIKIQGKFYREAERDHKKEREIYLKELKGINQKIEEIDQIKKLPKKRNRKHRMSDF